MKQLIDYLHFYLGCDLKTDTGVVKLIAVQKEVIPCTDYRVICLNGNVTHELKGEFKPILRPLSDMTEEERKFLATIGYFNPVFDYPLESQTLTPDQFIWLLKNSFDLFDLIESGLAIDKTTYNQQQV